MKEVTGAWNPERHWQKVLLVMYLCLSLPLVGVKEQLVELGVCPLIIQLALPKELN
jgi:hypothetical protein